MNRDPTRRLANLRHIIYYASNQLPLNSNEASTDDDDIYVSVY